MRVLGNCLKVLLTYLCMPPVPHTVQVAQLEALHLAEVDLGQGPRHLPRHEGLPPPGALVVEQDPVTGVHGVGLAVVHH